MRRIFHITKRSSPIYKQPVTLALGGGGARGLAHIGVLQILERENIPIQGIVGTSMGAIVGALFALRPNSQHVEDKIRQFLKSPLFEQTASPPAQHSAASSFLEQAASQLCDQMRDGEKMREKVAFMDAEMLRALDLLFQGMDVRDCTIPFAAAATDLKTGREVLLTSGPLVQAVFASAAMPGVFSPVSINGSLLSDGAATSAVPIRAARSLWPKTEVLAVDVSAELSAQPPMNNALEIILRISAITGFCYHNELIKEADVLIQPRVKFYGWNEFDKIENIISEGQRATQNNLSLIKRHAASLNR